jgi:drug/metabolite transporter (DMT)-like permease
VSAPALSLTAPLQRLPLIGHRIGDVVVSRRIALIGLALGIVYVVWGSTYLAIAVVVTEFPPMLVMAARFLLAGGLLFAVSIRRGDRAADRVRPRHLLQGVLTGGLLLVGGTGFIALAQTRISSGLAALLASTVPLFLALFARGMFGERLSPRAWLGLLVGLIGIAVLVEPRGGQVGAILLALTGAAAWAGGSLRSRHLAGPRRPMVGASLEMLGAALVFAVFGLLRGEAIGLTLGGVSGRAWFAFGYLTVAGSLVAYTAYSWLLRNANTSLVGTYAYVNPIVAVGLGWLVLGEVVTARTALAGALVLGSVVLLVLGRPGEPVPAQPTSGADVFAGTARWYRIRRGLGSLPRAARLYRDPGALPYRPTGYDPMDRLDHADERP